MPADIGGVRNVPLYVVLHGMGRRMALCPRAGCMGLVGWQLKGGWFVGAAENGQSAKPPAQRQLWPGVLFYNLNSHAR